MSDYMKEAERLLDEFYLHVSATVSSALADEWSEVEAAQKRSVQARAALLAHIQRGAVPEGVGAFRHKETGQVRYTLIGGEHDEDEWEDVLIVPMLAAAPAPDHFRGVTKMVPAPAGVPMPDDDMSDALGELAGVDTHDVNLRDNPESYEILGRLLRTYGDAREAAGYARGLADERERCASVAWAHYMDTCRRKGIGPDVLPDWCCAAALRGEVK